MSSSAVAFCNVSEGYPNFETRPICCSGSTGTYPIPWVGIDEAPAGALAVIYLVLLLWTFMGVALAADVFMSAIEEVTSQEKTITTKVDGKVRRFRARVWNPTVANLTLMALGSSAPEILLSLIELLFGNMRSGDLGPSTIVGSAAFNLLVIIAVCVVAIPASDSRRIAVPRVYMCTATASVFAYLWLVIILQGTSPDIIDIPEAVLTFIFFPILVLIAYNADKASTTPEWRAKHPLISKLCCFPADETGTARTAAALGGAAADVPRLGVLMSLKSPDGSPASKEEVSSPEALYARTHTRCARSLSRSLGCAYTHASLCLISITPPHPPPPTPPLLRCSPRSVSSSARLCIRVPARMRRRC